MCDWSLYMECTGHACVNGTCVCPPDFISANDFVSPSFNACQVHWPSLLALYAIAACSSGLGFAVSLALAFLRRSRAPLGRVDSLFFGNLAVFQGAALVLSIRRMSDMNNTLGVDPLVTVAFAVYFSSCSNCLSLWLVRLEIAVLRFLVTPSQTRTWVLPLEFLLFQLPVMASLITALFVCDKSALAIAMATAVSLFALVYLVYLRHIFRILRAATDKARGRIDSLRHFEHMNVGLHLVALWVIVLELAISSVPQLMPALYGHLHASVLVGLTALMLSYLVVVEVPRARRGGSQETSKPSTGHSTERITLQSLVYNHARVRNLEKLSMVPEEGANEIGE